MPNNETRCGFVGVIGIPNAGKSTLVNRLVGAKVSIVSHKVHTTRNRILGIAIHKNTQIILADTPGIFDAGGARNLEKAMVQSAFDALNDSEFIIHIVDMGLKSPLEKNKALIKKMPKDKPVLLVLNKTDKIAKPKLLEAAAQFNDMHDYAATFMISALNGGGVDKLADYLAENLPKGDWVFDEDQISDMPMRLMAAEITREKIFNQLHKELPYAAFVYTEKWEHFDNGSIKIDQVVCVERDTQKAIVLGKGGARVKQIGQEARLELEEILQTRVHLKLFVKVQDRWAERDENLRLIGLME